MSFHHGAGGEELEVTGGQGTHGLLQDTLLSWNGKEGPIVIV